MSKQPSRIDLLELDIDLRLADLWREAADISEWNLDVVAAFMRAAYGKGYCDALTEDLPGSLSATAFVAWYTSPGAMGAVSSAGGCSTWPCTPTVEVWMKRDNPARLAASSRTSVPPTFTSR
jgi:hypothetical protein